MTSFTFEIELDRLATDQLAELESATSKTEAVLLADAIRRLHRIYIGEPPPVGPESSTGPFSKLHSDLPAEVVLRQVDPTRFELREPFLYADGNRVFNVPMSDLTDLASVPRFFQWLVPRYGRHTLAALLHDHLQHHLRDRDHHDFVADPQLVTSEEADAYFRVAMQRTGVPFLRRWLMWAGVALRTEVKRGVLPAIATITWISVFGLIGIATPIWALLNIVAGWAGVAACLITMGLTLALPIVGSSLWLRRWRCGLMSGLALVTFGGPTLLVIVALGLYLGVEWLAERTQRHRVPIILHKPRQRRSLPVRSIQPATNDLL